MHTIVLTLVILVFSFVPVVAEDVSDLSAPAVTEAAPTAACPALPPDLGETFAVTPEACMAAEVEEARRGCCSWHGGVCGCSRDHNRLRCCDGALSPTCGC